MEASRQEECQEELLRVQLEMAEASVIQNPLTSQQVFTRFGLMLGIFPPMALFLRFLLDIYPRQNEIWVPLIFLLFVNFVCAIVGYFSGRLIGKMVAETEKWSWGAMLLTLPFIGILWGIMAGGAGGIFIYVIGAIFGAIFAAMVAGIALPIFTIFHRWLKKGDVMDRDQFLPIALGITIIISAFIFGLNIG
jgi:hypothetical protein